MNDKPKTWNIPVRTAEGKELQRKYAEAWPGLEGAKAMIQLNLDDIEAVLDRANDDADRVSVYEYREALNAVYHMAMRILSEKMAAEGHESLSEARAFALERERDDARAELQKTRDDFSSVWESRDEVIQERERARQACNAYWHDLSRIGSLCEQSADEYPLKAVERTVREFRAVIAERDAMKARIASMMESMSMACEEPPTNCECAGCSYAREKGGDA
jgi:hypothetical protein